MLTARSAAIRQFRPEQPPLPHGTLQRQMLSLDAGQVAYLRHGEGPPLLLVHGIPTSCRLWEPLLGVLGSRYDCIVPDLLGLGRSRPATESTDLSSPGQADMLAALLDALGIDRCFAVFHDQGGAHGMQMLQRHGGRVDAVVFTNCVCYDNWPVPMIDFSAWLGRHGMVPLLSKLGLMQATLRVVLNRTVARGVFPAALRDDWFAALNEGGEALQAWVGYVTAQSSAYTRDATPVLRGWDKPAQVLWAAEDRFLPVSWAVQLARDLCSDTAQPVLLPFAGHFWQAEVADSGAQALRDFFDPLC